MPKEMLSRVLGIANKTKTYIHLTRENRVINRSFYQIIRLLCSKFFGEFQKKSLVTASMYSIFKNSLQCFFKKIFFKLGLLNKIELNLLKLDSQIFPLLPTFYGLYMKEWKLP